CLTSCPPLWTGFNGKCFRLFHNHLNFDNAENACRQFGLASCSGDELATGHLASIHSAESQAFLTELVKTSLPDLITGGWAPQVYIGMKVGSTNSDQTWTDGSSVDYDGWVSGEPNNGPNSRGAIAAGDYSRGFWADVYSNNNFKYICQLPCVHYTLE
uniref:Lectin CEL-IV, C-type n=1 Tax=Pseudocnus echinatus TaxID=2592315 RepID=Q7M4F9_PSEEC|nr:Chain A, Lectin CEL-IV, C-type [Cucumaria echinata]3ALS_B Chain B, Lectin CEL-IV, C-type [Cucumaria echinata]3ALS_C Chain C, Lectin CEL-IV, C-type [Cucumaria echinata]3ALS_D Chain D, Lectin CEL-IV, C-type [Cucumaria echinata]3ALT_A Chain A, Lectin CEL-IV, C-type [Cucumaria echinata]3ALT_B Chain B, Lectin CEL-IV, C-type [Cucumaria echinata]3ALT_C Chain C, Lectin CEL-IV, C-type [Cucumaria echinata]3ALT_D Chain D, Lectin CEL-IV, C-type [Cucumaria echinata]3ALU_A Chain A, Lectin CEL-IV, C-ty